MTARKFKFRPKTIQMPWTPECRAMFSMPDNEEAPAFYSVTIKLKEVVFTARGRRDGWTYYHNLYSANFLNISLVAQVKK